MVAYTVSANYNWDDPAFAGRNGNDTYAIAGCRLTIDTDTRYCYSSPNYNTGSIAGITIGVPYNGTNEVYVDGSKVRIIPFDGGSGNVPAVNTSIVQGSISSTFLGVWSAFNVAPTTPGQAMPSSGYIKVKNVVSGTYVSGSALTGITATPSGPDTVGWIEVVGVNASAYNIYYKGKFTVRGEWFEHSSLVTTGLSGSTYQLPASLDNTFYAGVWVETAVSSGEYEFYSCAGSISGVETVATDTIRGKVCWISTQGLVRLGYDGTYRNGYLPEAGRKIRVPNINFTMCTSTTLKVNDVPYSSLTNRPEFGTTGGGIVDIDKCNIAWYMTFGQAYSINITNTAIADYLLITDIATPFVLNNVGVGITQAQVNAALLLQYLPLGGTVTDVIAPRYSSAATAYATYFLNARNITCTRLKTWTYSRAETRSYVLYLVYVKDCTFTDCTWGGGHLTYTTGESCTFTNSTFFDQIQGYPHVSYVIYTFNLAYAKNTVIDGLSFGGVAGAAPYSYIVYSGVDNDILIKNIGSPSAPLDCGGPRVDGVVWTSNALTASVTSPSHGIKAGETVFVPISSDVSIVTANAAKTVMSASTDTFTFVCLTGAVTGSLSYNRAISSGFLYTVPGYLCNITLRNCYFSNFRSNTFLSDNTATVNMDNCWGDIQWPALQFMCDSFVRGAKGGPSFVPQQSCQGTHWSHYWYGELSQNTVSQSWNRIGTTCYITSSNHNLNSGNSVIFTDFDNVGSLNGVWNKVATPITKDMFSVGLWFGTGPTSGTVSYTNHDGIIGVQMNAPSDASLASGQVAVTSGSVNWSTAGTVWSQNTGATIVWETPDYILGCTGFHERIVPIAGIGAGVNEWFFHDFTYQVDKNNGAGYGAWHNLLIPRAFTGSSGSYALTCSSTAGLEAGDYIWGQTGLEYRAKIVSVDTLTTLTLDKANTAGLGGGSSGVSHILSEGTLDPAKGFKMKVKDVSLGTGSTVGNSNIIFYVTSTTGSRAILYPDNGVCTAYTLWNPSIGDAVYLTPSGSSTQYRATVIGSRFPVQDPISSSLGRYEYLVKYNDTPSSTVSTSPWHQLWTTVNGYIPVYSALSFIPSLAGNPSSGSITRYVP